MDENDFMGMLFAHMMMQMMSKSIDEMMERDKKITIQLGTGGSPMTLFDFVVKSTKTGLVPAKQIEVVRQLEVGQSVHIEELDVEVSRVE